MTTATEKTTKTNDANSKASKPEAKKTSAAAKSLEATKSPEATALLRADHKHVAGLFEEYEATKSTAKKKKLVAEICTELSVHAQVEEEIFYPAVQKALKDHELVPEATVEHASMKELIAQVEGKEPDGDMFDAKVTVLSEYVKHHVKEEQNDMFPKAKAASLDLHALGAEIAERKAQLLAERGKAS